MDTKASNSKPNAKSTNKKSTAASKSVARLKRSYVDTFQSELMSELGLNNVNLVPKLNKIVVNVGLGKAKDDKKLLEIAGNTVKKITGQQPIETKAKTSIAAFKLREDSKIGLMVTLRGDIMYEFMDRVINIVLPRLRDFHGVSAKAFDKSGNYSLGFRDQSAFPELTFEETTTLHGLQMNFVIKAVNPEHSRALLTKFGMPFEKPGGRALDKKEKK